MLDKSCLKVRNTCKQDIDIETFNSLVKFNTHVNRFSLYDHNKVDERHRRVQFNYKSINDKWNAH